MNYSSTTISIVNLPLPNTTIKIKQTLDHKITILHKYKLKMAAKVAAAI